MEWKVFAEMAKNIIISLGGCGVVTIALIKIFGNRCLDMLEERYASRLNKELEQFKTVLENQLYVKKLRFDAEFEIYRQLSAAAVTMVGEVDKLFPAFEGNVYEDCKGCQEQYDVTQERIMFFHNTLAANVPFISKEMYLLFQKLEEKCKSQLSTFKYAYLQPGAEKRKEYNGGLTRREEISFTLEAIIEKLHNYLETLERI